jgi:hypothetical protein
MSTSGITTRIWQDVYDRTSGKAIHPTVGSACQITVLHATNLTPRTAALTAQLLSANRPCWETSIARCGPPSAEVIEIFCTSLSDGRHV